MRDPDYICFSDESYIGARFRSLAACTCSYATYKYFHHELLQLVAAAGTQEFKWQKLRNAKYRRLAEQLIDWSLQNSHESDVRVDVLTWDTHDSRHAHRCTDDKANFERMLYHILNITLRKRPHGSTWRVYPDQKLDVDWEMVEACVSYRGKRRRDVPNALFANLFAGGPYTIERFKEVESHKAPLSQVADLFAGLASFSALRYDDYVLWNHEQGPNQSLLPVEGRTESSADPFRFQVLDYFDGECKRYKAGVSLRRNRRLVTYNPARPLNFWPYEPQGEHDRAPTR